MTRISFLISLLLNLQMTALFAQKIDLDKRKFNTEYAILPTDPTLSYFDRYSVDFFTEQATIDQIGISTASINSYFDLEGYVYTKEDAQFNYSISIDKPIPLLEGIEDVQQAVKNPDGTTRIATMYVAVSTYSILTHIGLTLIPSGKEVYASTFSSRSTPTVFKSTPQVTREAAQSILNLKSKGINTSLLNVYIKTLTTEVAKLKQKYCFQSFTSSSLLWEINEKNAPELAPFNKEVHSSIAILEKLTKNTPISNARTEMASSLAYWSSKAASIKSSEKNSTKLKYACLYNSAVCQYYLELYDDCITSCQLLISNGYDKSDGTILQNQAILAKETLAKSGLASQHQNRIGFTTTERFEYIKIVIKKPNFIEQNKQDLKGLKDAGTSLGNVGKEIYKDVTPPKITDTLLSSETYFSYARFTQNGEFIELKGHELKLGSATPNTASMHCKTLYGLSLFKKDALIRKESTVDGFRINFTSNYNNSASFNADSLIALIKFYQNDKLKDITACESDTIPFRNNEQVISSKIVLGKDYTKKIAAEVDISYHLNGNEGNQDYMTNNGDSFNISIVDVVPVIVKNNLTGNIMPHAYLIRMKIPEVTLTKIMIGHIWFYTYEYATLKNIELRVLVY